jgi:hypothetical protein
MTKHHDDDPNLVNFLRQHRPQIPPTSPELEGNILQQVSQYQASKREKLISIADFQRRFLYLLSPAMAMGLVIFISNYRAINSPQISDGELSKIGTFMENNWHDALSEQPENNSFLLN